MTDSHESSRDGVGTDSVEPHVSDLSASFKIRDTLMFDVMVRVGHKGRSNPRHFAILFSKVVFFANLLGVSVCRVHSIDDATIFKMRGFDKPTHLAELSSLTA